MAVSRTQLYYLAGAAVLTVALYFASGDSTPEKKSVSGNESEHSSSNGFDQLIATAKSSLSQQDAAAIAALEGQLNAASGKDTAILASLGRAWDGLHSSGVAAHYFREIAEANPGEKEWLNAAYRYFDAFKSAEDSLNRSEMVNEAIESSTPKRAAKSVTEEEPVTINVGLAPNLSAGEKLLEGRDDLKAKLSDIIQEGVEFAYAPTDIGWQWALDRANWATISGSDVSRRIKIKTGFTEGAVGIEMGVGGTKKRATKKVAEVAPEPVEVVEEAE